MNRDHQSVPTAVPFDVAFSVGTIVGLSIGFICFVWGAWVAQRDASLLQDAVTSCREVPALHAAGRRE